MEKPCKVCGKSIHYYPCNVNKKVYCSKECKIKDTHSEQKCLLCEKVFMMQKCRLGEKTVKHRCCSKECYNNYKRKIESIRRENKTYICSNCEKKFIALRHGKTKMKFCSQECSKDYMRGEKSPFYSGGVIVNNGYKAIYQSRGVYKLEHRHLMELKIGRPIKANEVVHHIDGNKKNNDINNLQLMDKREHDRLHTKRRHEHEKRFGKSKSAL